VVVKQPEVGLGWGIALFGGDPEPSRGFLVVGLRPLAGVVGDAEAELCGGITLVGSQPEPFERLLLISRDAMAVEIEFSEIELGRRVVANIRPASR
jgi:hypothetical protein